MFVKNILYSSFWESVKVDSVQELGTMDLDKEPNSQAGRWPP